MATQQTQTLARFMLAPSVIMLLVWMIVPLAHHPVVLLPAVQSAQPDPRRLRRLRQLRAVLRQPGLPPVDPQHADPRRQRARHHRHRRHHARAAARPADVGPGHRPHPGDLALLRHAAGGGAGVEEHDHAPGLRRLCRHFALLRPAADRLVRAISAVFDHHDRRLAMAALRHADPADRAAVARRRAEGSRRNGRRRLRQPLHLPDAAAPGARASPSSS